MPFHKFANAEVKAVFDASPPALRPALMAVREMIFDVAHRTPGVGPLDECLKWGEPAYLTAETGSGSTVRLTQDKTHPDRLAVHLNCNTTLVAQFREIYPGTFVYAGNRSILLDGTAPPPAELAHCIALALTYHLAKRRARPQRAPSEAHK